MAEGSTSAVDQVQQVLENLRAISGEVEAAVVLSEGGELKGSTLAPGVDRERYAAMVGALVGIARRVARENGGTGFAQARIREEGGYVLLVNLGGGDTLAATAGPDARVGLVLYDMRNAGKELERTFGFEGGGRQ